MICLLVRVSTTKEKWIFSFDFSDDFFALQIINNATIRCLVEFQACSEFSQVHMNSDDPLENQTKVKAWEEQLPLVRIQAMLSHCYNKITNIYYTRCLLRGKNLLQVL